MGPPISSGETTLPASGPLRLLVMLREAKA